MTEDEVLEAVGTILGALVLHYEGSNAMGRAGLRSLEPDALLNGALSLAKTLVCNLAEAWEMEPADAARLMARTVYCYRAGEAPGL